jgi:perosamine synthetase
VKRLNEPVLGDEELAAVGEVLRSGYLTQGPKAAEFERAVTAVCGSGFGFATSSCTTALHLALVALGIGPGDEVVIPDYTFPATANVVVQLGAHPVVADIDEVGFGMRADSLAEVITERTCAIMPVHAFGLTADMDPIMAVADQHGIPVIEDAACALGGTYKGRPCGSIGRLGAFSFHPRKIITTGEGGMVVTDDAQLADTMAVLRTHGARRGDHYLSFEMAGFNYRLSDVHAAIGVVQMTRLDGILARRRQVAESLTARLAGLRAVRPPVEPDYARHTFQSYVVLLDPAVDRDGVIVAMRALDIETTLGTYSLQAQPFFRTLPSAMRAPATTSASVDRRALTLPLHERLSEDDLDRVVDALAATVARSAA